MLLSQLILMTTAPSYGSRLHAYLQYFNSEGGSTEKEGTYK
jgi:hypothetical protein